MMKLYLGREYRTFYYKYYPKTKEESFCFVDGDYGDKYIFDKISYDKAKKYPLGYLLSKCVQFYEKLRIEPLEQMRDFLKKEREDYEGILELEDVRNKILEYSYDISYDMSKDAMFYVDRRREVFKEVFPESKFGNNLYSVKNGQAYDCLELFSFFLINDIYEAEESLYEYQKERLVSSTIIFDFIEQCVTENYEFCGYENLCRIVMNNQDVLDNGYTSFEYSNDYQELNNMYLNTERHLGENVLYHVYKITKLDDFLYATLQEIFKNNCVIKRCEFCKNIFIPLKSKSNKYCNYKKYEQYGKTCYELHNCGMIMFKEKYNRCEKVKKQIRDRLNKWVEYHSNSTDEEDKKRTAIKDTVYELMKMLRNTIVDEDKYYDYLLKIKNTNFKNEGQFNKLEKEIKAVIENHQK